MPHGHCFDTSCALSCAVANLLVERDFAQYWKGSVVTGLFRWSQLKNRVRSEREREIDREREREKEGERDEWREREMERERERERWRERERKMEAERERDKIQKQLKKSSKGSIRLRNHSALMLLEGDSLWPSTPVLEVMKRKLT